MSQKLTGTAKRMSDEADEIMKEPDKAKREVLWEAWRKRLLKAFSSKGTKP